MPTILPPLTALRAFDAAARHMSFAKAAAELNVTPAALSFQIKSLEDTLGRPLFHRLNRAVELTEAGRLLAPGAEDGFRRLTAAWASVRRFQDQSRLTVTAGPAFTAKWLAPRLFDFAQAHPEVELQFSASLRLMDFDRDGIDVAIRFGLGQDDGVYSLPLAHEWLTPVMTPELAERYASPASLRDATLIVDESLDFLDPPCDWPAWFRAAGVEPAEAHGPRFSQADHAIDAALAGVGVALGRRSLAIKDIHENRLRAPFPIAIGTEARFRFLCPAGTEERPNVRAFRDWIQSEIRKTEALANSFTVIPVESLRTA